MPETRLHNVNKPKCVNCIRHLCNAGMVNHCIDSTGKRSSCYFECGCTEFVEYTKNSVINGRKDT